PATEVSVPTPATTSRSSTCVTTAAKAASAARPCWLPRTWINGPRATSTASAPTRTSRYGTPTPLPAPTATPRAGSWPSAGGRELDFTPYARRNTMAFVQHYIPGEPVEDDADNSLGWQLALRTHPDADTQLIYGLDGEFVHGTILEFQPEPLTTGTPQQDSSR